MLGEGFDQKVAGFLVEKELSAFQKVLDSPARPVLAILGGAKVSDKIQLIQNLCGKVDKMIIGGGMAFTFLKVLHNANIGEIILPTDFTVSSKFGEDGEIKKATLEEGVP